MFVVAAFLRNRVVAAFSPGMTTQDSFGRKETSVEQSMDFECLQSV